MIEGAIDPGRYRLSHVVCWYANPPLDEQLSIADQHVTNGAMLKLIAAEPAVAS